MTRTRNHKIRRQKRRAKRALKWTGLGLLVWYSDALGDEFDEGGGQ